MVFLRLGENLGIGAAQTLVNFDAAHFAQVETPAVKEVVDYKGASGVNLHRRLAGAQPLVQVSLGQADVVGLVVVEFPVRVHPAPQRPQFLLSGVIVPGREQAVRRPQRDGNRGESMSVKRARISSALTMPRAWRKVETPMRRRRSTLTVMVSGRLRRRA